MGRGIPASCLAQAGVPNSALVSKATQCTSIHVSRAAVSTANHVPFSLTCNHVHWQPRAVFQCEAKCAAIRVTKTHVVEKLVERWYATH